MSNDYDVPVRAVQNLCTIIKEGGTFARADAFKNLETCIFQGLGHFVRFSCRETAFPQLPQLYRKRPHLDLVYITCFIRTNIDEDTAFLDLLQQMSVAAVLLVSRADFVQDLPDFETCATFVQNYMRHGALSQEVYDTLVSMACP